MQLFTREAVEGTSSRVGRRVPVFGLADLGQLCRCLRDAITEDGEAFHPAPEPPSHPSFIHLPRLRATLDAAEVEAYIREDLILGRAYDEVLRGAEEVRKNRFFKPVPDRNQSDGGPTAGEATALRGRPRLAYMMTDLAIVRILESLGVVRVPVGFYDRPDAINYTFTAPPERPDFDVDGPDWRDGIQSLASGRQGDDEEGSILSGDEEHAHEALMAGSGSTVQITGQREGSNTTGHDTASGASSTATAAPGAQSGRQASTY
jgi:hypothetical protein